VERVLYCMKRALDFWKRALFLENDQNPVHIIRNPANLRNVLPFVAMAAETYDFKESTTRSYPIGN